MDARSPATSTASRPESAAGEAGWLVCIDCRSRIVAVSAKIEVGGAHRHEFVNPSAILFVVRCFQTAPGARGIGERSTTWTWFPGFAWEIELCRRCAGHVGWSFHGATTFYGLIADRMIEE